MTKKTASLVGGSGLVVGYCLEYLLERADYELGTLRKFRAIEAKAVAYAMVKESIVELQSVYIWQSDEIQQFYDSRHFDEVSDIR